MSGVRVKAIGDLIPEYVLNKDGAKGSGADNSNVSGVWKDSMWTVVWVRPLTGLLYFFAYGKSLALD